MTGIVVTVVALTATNGQAAVRVSATTADATEPTVADFPVASSPHIHSLRVLSWLKYGGQELLDGISAAQNDYTVLVTTPPVTYAVVVSRVRPVCVGIERDVAKGARLFPRTR